MACVAKVSILNPNIEEGKEELIIPLPSINSLDDVSNDSLSEIVDNIINDKETFNNFKSIVNNSKLKRNRWIIDNFDENDLPVGNTNLEEISNKYSSNNVISTYLNGLKQLGVPTDINNVLLLDNNFSYKYFTLGGVYSVGGKDLGIIQDSENNIKAYLNYLYTYNWLENNQDTWQAKMIKSKIEDITNELKAIYKDDNESRIWKIIPIIENNPKEFIKYFKLSSYFYKKVFNSKSFWDLHNLISGIIDVNSMKVPPYYDNVYVKEFIELIKDGKVSKDDFNKFKNKYNFNSLEDVIYFLNGKDANLELVFEGENIIQFKELLKNKATNEDMVDYNLESEYYSNLVNIVYSNGEFNIVSVIDSDGNYKYYVTDKYATSVEDLSNNTPFTKFSDAKSNMYEGLKNSITFNDYKINLKTSSNNTFNDNHLKIGDKFKMLDIKIDPNTELDDSDKALFRSFGIKRGTFQFSNTLDFIQNFKKNRTYNRIKADFNYLNTKEKIETFFLIKSQLAKENSKMTKTELCNKAIDILKNAKYAIFEVIDIKDKIVTVNKLSNVATKFENNTAFEDADVRTKIINIADRLSSQFGIQINLISSEDSKQFPFVKGSENGFIYNGEIYINLDNAHPKDVLHEYAHLILGSIKQRNPELYYSLIGSVEKTDNYIELLNKYSELYSNRARADIQEEIFVDLFGEINLNLNQEAEVKDEIKKIFGLNNPLEGESLKVLSNMTLNDLLLNFGSVVLAKDNNLIDYSLSTNSRVISNLVEKLMKLGILKENCNG